MGFFTRSIVYSVVFAIFAAVLVNIPNLPPDSTFEEFRFAPVPALEGPLALNDALNNAEHLFVGEAIAPEGLAIHKNVLYTGLADGRIVALKNNKLVTVASLAKSCEKHEDGHCGHILGLEFDKAGNLFVVDCYTGIYKVNITTGAVSLAIPANKPIDGEVPQLPDDVDIGSDGSIYWSDASAKFPLHKFVLSILGDTSGRLIRTNLKTGKSEVLVKGLRFANGVFLADDESYVAVAETFASRVHRYWLKGPKKGTAEIFIDNLPGYPDNISPYKNGGFVVNALISRESPDMIGALAPFPNVRKFFARVIALSEIALQKMYDAYPNSAVQFALYHLQHLDAALVFIQNHHYTALFYDKNGKLTKALHSTDGSLPATSDFAELGGYYYFGSPFNPFLSRKKISY
nr:PREDICTED: adipocyte plasma membrane-associated protein-like isoform X1 [Bemisia tabaci]